LTDCRIGERTVRQYVHDRIVALGLVVHQTFVRQSYVDCYEAYADLSGERTRLQVFAMRGTASGAAFHCAFLPATQRAFLEVHERASSYHCGVFPKLRYDNLTEPGHLVRRSWPRRRPEHEHAKQKQGVGALRHSAAAREILDLGSSCEGGLAA
jgi:hypothetical protein